MIGYEVGAAILYFLNGWRHVGACEQVCATKRMGSYSNGSLLNDTGAN